jgi:hypothetical protein
MIINSDYIFYPSHSFKNINLKFVDTKNKTNEEKYLLSGNLIYIDSEIKI